MSSTLTTDAEALLGVIYVWDDRIPSYSQLQEQLPKSTGEVVTLPSQLLSQWSIFQDSDPREIAWDDAFFAKTAARLSDAFTAQLQEGTFLHTLIWLDKVLPELKQVVRSQSEGALSIKQWGDLFGESGIALENFTGNEEDFLSRLAQAEGFYERELVIDSLALELLFVRMKKAASWAKTFFQRMLDRLMLTGVSRFQRLDKPTADLEALIPQKIRQTSYYRAARYHEVTDPLVYLRSKSEDFATSKIASEEEVEASLEQFFRQEELNQLSLAFFDNDPELVALYYYKKINAFFYNLQLIALSAKVPPMRKSLENLLVNYSVAL